jgi:N-acetylglucosamine-6-phosphate deacetylase
VDLHYHGSLPFLEPGGYPGALADSARDLLRHGTTAFLATTLAWPGPELLERVTALSACLDDASKGAAAILGIHLEGPWIRAAAAGAQPPEGIRPYQATRDREVFERCEGLLRMVTLAPEVPGADRLQAHLERRGVVTALGHSLADATEVRHAVERGARHVTHLFNAMGPLHHRAPGLAGVALTDDRLTCDLICDGVHVDPALVDLAVRAKGEGLVLITDRVALPEPAAQARFGEAGAVHDDGEALRLADGRLAGSSLGLDRALRNAERFTSMTRLDAVAACSLRPARVLGVETQRGTLRPGARADFVILTADGSVRETWVGGRRLYAV